MRKMLATLATLIVVGALPLLAQEEAPGAGGAREDVQADRPAVGPQVAPQEEQRRAIQEENAARTEVPPVRGAERVPATPQEQQGEVAGAGQETDVTQRAAEEETYEAGGEMPTTDSSLPLIFLSGAILLAAGLTLRLAMIRR